MATTPIYDSPRRIASSANKEDSPEVNRLKILIQSTTTTSSRSTQTRSPRKAVIVELNDGLRIKALTGAIDPEDRKAKKTAKKTAEGKTF